MVHPLRPQMTSQTNPFITANLAFLSDMGDGMDLSVNEQVPAISQPFNPVASLFDSVVPDGMEFSSDLYDLSIFDTPSPPLMTCLYPIAHHPDGPSPAPPDDEPNQPLHHHHHHAHQQQHSNASVRRATSTRKKNWEEIIYRYEIDAERWIRHEQRVAVERQKMKERIQELKRIDERVRHRREKQKRLIGGLMERDKKERDRVARWLEKSVLESWDQYESRWADLPNSAEPLTFASILWPMVIALRHLEDITPAAITSFLFSEVHSQSVPRKDRIRRAQLRWHPDRFRRLMARVPEQDKKLVEEGTGIVARCLNDLMEREKLGSR